MDALERRKTQYREVTPPETKSPSKGKASRTSSAVNLASDKSKKKGGNRLFGLPAANSSKSRAPKSPKTSRKPSPESSAPAAPGFMMPGPDGRPVYAPFGYFPPPPEALRPGSSRSGSRSASSSSRKPATPPYDMPYPPPYPSRYYPMPPEDYRPPSSSRRSPEELFMPRARAASTAQYPVDPYGSRPAPVSGSGRRNVSGPPDVPYSKLRRVAPSSPLAEYPHREQDSRDRRPVPRAQQSSSGSSDSPETNEGTPSSSSSEDDEDEEEVKVEVVQGSKGQGYTVDRVPVGKGGESRRRRRK